MHDAGHPMRSQPFLGPQHVPPFGDALWPILHTHRQPRVDAGEQRRRIAGRLQLTQWLVDVVNDAVNPARRYPPGNGVV